GAGQPVLPRSVGRVADRSGDRRARQRWHRPGAAGGRHPPRGPGRLHLHGVPGRAAGARGDPGRRHALPPAEHPHPHDLRGAAVRDLAPDVRRELRGESFGTLSGKMSRLVPTGEREVSLLVSEGTASTPATKRVPWTQVVPAPDGSFSARVPRGRDYLIEVW